jgi:hypothetical protein
MSSMTFTTAYYVNIQDYHYVSEWQTDYNMYLRYHLK